MIYRTPVLKEYYEALQRIEIGKPIRIQIGVKITNDSVALEAGRKKGSIKKSRQMFDELIDAIAVAARRKLEISSENQLIAQLNKTKGTVHKQRKDMDAIQSALLSRLYEVHELKKKVSSLESQVEILNERLSLAVNRKLRPIAPL